MVWSCHRYHNMDSTPLFSAVPHTHVIFFAPFLVSLFRSVSFRLRPSSFQVACGNNVGTCKCKRAIEQTTSFEGTQPITHKMREK